MRSIGRRPNPLPAAQASGALLSEGARFSESFAALGCSTFIPKGLHRFRTHEEANHHWRECIAQGIARIAMQRA